MCVEHRFSNVRFFWLQDYSRIFANIASGQQTHLLKKKTLCIALNLRILQLEMSHFYFNHCILNCCFVMISFGLNLPQHASDVDRTFRRGLDSTALTHINSNSHQLFSPKLLFFFLKCLSSDHLYSSLDLFFLSTIISLCHMIYCFSQYIDSKWHYPPLISLFV